MFYWKAEPTTVQGPRKGESSRFSMRNGLRPQPARLVRGSSRRIMSMRFRPAHIRVINRRASSSTVIGSAVQIRSAPSSPAGTCSRYAARRGNASTPERCSPARVRFATPNDGVPLPAPRRSGQAMVRRAAPTGTLHGSFQKGTGRLPSLRRIAGPIKKHPSEASWGLDRVAPYQKCNFNAN
jgi:hypothetical protein